VEIDKVRPIDARCQLPKPLPLQLPLPLQTKPGQYNNTIMIKLEGGQHPFFFFFFFFFDILFDMFFIFWMRHFQSGVIQRLEKEPMMKANKTISRPGHKRQETSLKNDGDLKNPLQCQPLMVYFIFLYIYSLSLSLSVTPLPSHCPPLPFNRKCLAKSRGTDNGALRPR